MGPFDILGQTAEFERSRLYLSVYSLIDGVRGKPAPRAALPDIVLDSAKTTRRLTVESYASRALSRYRGCLGRI